ncbi:MAG: TrkA family potassium uptake protein [Lachnospiraceae bacterium]|nr:TrkA family potassium uptake protein [Lachnospiraceae bacterium]MBP5250516.1 TrkA family potassium uptake protein [Lachnospiraceae bacterium]
MKKSIAVLGLGNYGMSLAKEMYRIGADVLAVDKDEEKVKEIADFCTEAVCADLTSEEEIGTLDLKNMDIVVCAMGRNLAASIMAITVSKEQNVPSVVAKSSSARMTSILKKVGADKVIIPEEENGIRSARIIASDTVLDYFQVDDNLSMIEMNPEPDWIGRSLVELNLRKQYKINIVAMQENKDDKWELISPSHKLSETCRLLVVLEKSQLGKLTHHVL